MNTQERQSAISVVQDLLTACGPQTMVQILRELKTQAIGCNNIHDAKEFAAYAISELKRLDQIEEQEYFGLDGIEDETYYGLKGEF